MTLSFAGSVLFKARMGDGGNHPPLSHLGMLFHYKARSYSPRSTATLTWSLVSMLCWMPAVQSPICVIRLGDRQDSPLVHHKGGLQTAMVSSICRGYF